jgi:hypothetical protein
MSLAEIKFQLGPYHIYIKIHHFTKMKGYYIIGGVPKSYRKIVKTSEINTLSIHIHDRSPSESEKQKKPTSQIRPKFL